jgi:very-short-patch-repair endonuclease
MFDREIARLASGQYGLFTRAQALALGMTLRMIENRQATGRWIRVAPGVYGLPGVAPSWRRDLLAACFQAGPMAVASHEAAAGLHSLASFPPGPVVVMLPHGDHQHLRSAGLRQSTDLRPSHCTAVDNIPVTTVPRTLADLAAVVRSGRLRHAVENALAAKACTLEELAECHAELRRPGKRGMRDLGLVLAALGPGPTRSISQLERLLLKVLRDGGLPEPVREYDAPWDRNAPGRVDVAYPWAWLILEADSRRWHTREKDFEADRRRDRLAQLAGYDVYRFTWRDLKDDPGDVVQTVERALVLGVNKSPIR